MLACLCAWLVVCFKLTMNLVLDVQKAELMAFYRQLVVDPNTRRMLCVEVFGAPAGAVGSLPMPVNVSQVPGLAVSHSREDFFGVAPDVYE